MILKSNEERKVWIILKMNIWKYPKKEEKRQKGLRKAEASERASGRALPAFFFNLQTKSKPSILNY